MFGMFTIFKEPKAVTIVRGALISIIGIVILIMGIVGLVRINADPIDLNDTHMDWNQLHNGQHVEMDVDVLIGQYMTTTDNGTEVARDYLMPHITHESNNYYGMDRVIGVKINRSSGDFDTADTIVNNTVLWWRDRSGDTEYNTVTIHVDGYLQKMDDNQIKFAKEAMTAAGFTPHDLASMIVPYYISDNSSSGQILLVIGIICTLVGASVIVFGATKKPQQ